MADIITLGSNLTQTTSKSIRIIFSENLNYLCRDRGRKADLARATGISPVQVNRYLSGTIPNDHNISLIADYFNLNQVKLFDPFMKQADESSEKNIKTTTRRFDRAERSSHATAKKFPSGLYSTYSAVPGDDERLVRSATRICRKNNATIYRRYVAFGLHSVNSRSYWSVHEGSVLGVQAAFYFRGMNLLEPHEPTLSCYRSLPLDGITAFSGSTFVSSGGTMHVLQSVMIREDQRTPLRSLIRKSHIRHFVEFRDGLLVMRILANALPDTSVFGV